MYLHSDFDVKISDKSIPKMAIIDIDEVTHREWGSPVLIPRSKIKNLIERSVVSGARTIVVDIDLAWSADGCIHESNMNPICLPTQIEDEDLLGAYLKEINESQNINTPIIILTRLYRFPLDEKGQIDNTNILTAPPSFLDKWIKEEKRVFWASTFFVSSENILRYWYLAPLVCKETHLNIVPSAALIATLSQLYTEDERVTKLQLIKQQWNNWAQRYSCNTSKGNDIKELCKKDDCSSLKVTLPKNFNFRIEDTEIYLPSEHYKNKILYRFAPLDTFNQPNVNLFEYYSAKTTLTETLDLDKKLVFIGATHSLSYDFYFTPIRYKKVAGLYILANATDSLLRVGHTKTLPYSLFLPLALLSIIITTFSFAIFKEITAFFISSFIGIFVLSYSGIMLLQLGFDIRSILPLFLLNIIFIFLHFISNIK